MSKELQEVLNNLQTLFNELINLLGEDKITAKDFLELRFTDNSKEFLLKKYALTIMNFRLAIKVCHNSNQDTEIYLVVSGHPVHLDSHGSSPKWEKLIEALKGECNG